MTSTTLASPPPYGAPVTARTYSGRTVPLWPSSCRLGGISIKDIAAHLGKIVYFPESAHAPFTAAQYAVELAQSLKSFDPSFQLYGLLTNAHEAYLGHIPAAARDAERWMTMPPIVEDPRDQLIEAMRARILHDLFLTGSMKTTAQVCRETMHRLPVIDGIRRRLDATLERDLGAYIHRASGQERATPLPRVIAPLRWDRAIELYVHNFEAFCALTGRTAAA
jgi:hypothetical protein